VVVEARDRVGGRVWTLRDGFADGQHAEAGGDLIDGGQTHVLTLADELGIGRARILRNGFGYYGVTRSGRRAVYRGGAWGGLARLLEEEIRAYTLNEHRWEGPIAAALARESVAGWLDRIGADARTRSVAGALRGFFVADPADLSLIALVDQFATDGDPSQEQMFRLKGGNDRLAAALAGRLGDGVRLNTVLRRVAQDAAHVRATVTDRHGASQAISADYAVMALPAVTLRDVQFQPPLPAPQGDAVARLRYGRATRGLVQFERRFWRRMGRASAFGTDLPIGAVWDGNEEQADTPGILSMLAGGTLSRDLHTLGARGLSGIAEYLGWLGRPPREALSFRTVTWEDESWSRGAYAYFDPSFDPELRAWLARPHGRIVFAGEHTSVRWQGYMNGAVESGLRAVEEIRSMR
jgi:monoamine oxidase